MILSKPPREVCILRLSAIGDVCHVLPVLRTLQQAWPKARFTWVIGRVEAKLVGLVPDVEFITFDKRHSLRDLGQFRTSIREQRFDLLLHMQLALRASFLSSYVRSPIKLGFDRARARELQWLFTTHRIAARDREHVMDSFFGFAEALGVHDRVLRWDIPLPGDARHYAAQIINDQRPTLVISPCSSHARRNWRAEYYAAVADHAATAHAMRVVVVGGPSKTERKMGQEIERHVRQPVINTVGRDTLQQLLALLQRADVLLSPDSGPVHMASAVGIPVIGLYAATNPERSGPYLSRSWCVSKYDEAARKYLGRPASEIAWTTKIERPGVMDLITPADVIRKLDKLMGQRGKQPRKWA
ncbi:MAG TPA: glycosyltransferase family 9 protein [Steroidobacteraceae bacterium]|nr:glycosyltransferase family 9 protein [Steroidobacteraceae bacterium]